ncbi:MAG: ParA family protein [Pseudanabaenaceae cyanobacterium]
MKTIAVYHNKGGVGKTTTVVHLAATLAKKGYQVLIIDLDSQANTTFATGLVKFVDEEHDTIRDNNVSHLLESRTLPITEVIRVATYNTPAVSVIPAHIMIMGQERIIADTSPAHIRLRNKLKDVTDFYDYVLIDTPPSLNIYAKIALLTADYLLIPSDMKPFANQGLHNVKRFIEDTNEDRETRSISPLQVLGVLPSKVSTNPKYLEFTFPSRRQIVTNKYGFNVLESYISQREILSKTLEQETTIGNLESISDPRSIFDYQTQNHGEKQALEQAIEEFNTLANEVIYLTND